MLEEFEQKSVPYPLLLEDQDHYPKMLQLLNNQVIKEQYKKKLWIL